MDWIELELSDKDLINSFLRNYPGEASEMTFTNLFLWRIGADISYQVIDGFLCIKHTSFMHQPQIFVPMGTGDMGNVLEQMQQEWNKKTFPLMIMPTTRELADKLMNSYPGKFECISESNYSDYIYSVEDLIKLPGRKFHDKKNMINRFARDNQFEYLPITDLIIDDVIIAAEEWCELRNCEDYIELEHEKEGIFECLKHFNDLDCEGAVIRVDGKIIAFTFGEMLTKDMVVIHIEKADPRIPGAYQIINQQFLEHRWSDVTWVNREGDMGLEGLRKAKQSYNPHRMIEKYCLKQIR